MIDKALRLGSFFVWALLGVFSAYRAFFVSKSTIQFAVDWTIAYLVFVIAAYFLTKFIQSFNKEEVK